jgi:predicted RNA-binding Zn ribbon-like protein
MTPALDKRTFELIAGHPALDLVNTLDWRFRESGSEELLETYSDLLRFAAQSGLLSARQARQLRDTSASAGSRVLAATRELREAIAEVLYGRLDGHKPSSMPIKTLERLFKTAREGQKLVWSGPRFKWDWAELEASPEFPLWLLSRSASGLMLSENMANVRACDNLECRWLFLDTSKSHRRRWCDMRICGNRMKARRFKAQRRASEVD